MSFDTSGKFTRTGGTTTWQTVAASPDKRIKSLEHDQHDQDIADGLSDCLNRRGNGGALADLSMGGFRLTNLFTSPTPAGTDAATVNYVNTVRTFSTGMEIDGTDANGRITFTQPTGTQGIVWNSTTTSLLARKGVTDREQDRLVVNNGSTDVVTIDDDNGTLNYPGYADITSNLINDQIGTWRTPVAGTGSIFRTGVGVIQSFINYTATTLAYGSVTALKAWFNATASGGNVDLTLNKKASGNQVTLSGRMDDKARWIMGLGDGTAEDAPPTGSTGSNFFLNTYNNDGSYNVTAMTVSRNTGRVNFPKGIDTGDTIGSAGNMTIGGATGIFLRPNGVASTTGQVNINSTGDIGGIGTVYATQVNCTGGASVGSADIAGAIQAGNFQINGTGNGWDTGVIGNGQQRSSRGAGAANHYLFYNNNGLVGLIQTNGTTTTYSTTSDERLKDFGEALTFEEAMTIIDADPVRHFTWKADGAPAVGWSAQRSWSVSTDLASPPPDEVKDIAPGDEGFMPWGVDQAKRTPYLWAAVSGLLKKIEVLEARIAELEARP